MIDKEEPKPTETAETASQAHSEAAENTSPPSGANAHLEKTEPVPVRSGSGDTASPAVTNPLMDDVWSGLKRLPNYARLAAAMARDPRVPGQAKAALLVGGGYMVSPIDLVPGIIPVAGQIDDLYVVLVALRQAIRMTPDEVAHEHLRTAGVALSDLDNDLRAIRRLVKEAAVKTARFGWRMARQASQQVIQLTNQMRDRSRKGPNHEPL